ncbi:MAG: D-alanine--D-alanine ligase [Firmicutes bacterium]|nr:D-alanine--D-alanine ligase [Bacillota bacterium]
MSLKIGVLYGGKSTEREVSLRTGEAVYQGLLKKGYQVIKIDPADENFIDQIKNENIDVAFLALHGKYGEDGTIQGLLEILGVPYTGSGVMSSSVAMNKIATKKLLLADNIPTPGFCTYTKEDVENMGIEQVTNEIVGKLSLPVVIKAPTQGSTIGISFVKKKDEIEAALNQSFKYDSEIMAEKFISGTEVTATVLGNEDPQVLPQIEIVSATGVYDYKAKYTVGMSDHIIPPNLPEKYLNITTDLALRTHKTLNCQGLSRVDFIVTNEGKIYVLEANTLPGMTETSLVPDSARAAGIEFPELVNKLVQLALQKNA